MARRRRSAPGSRSHSSRQSAGQLTTQSHPFLLSDLSGTCIGIFTATDRPSVGYLTTPTGGSISGTVYADAAAPGNEVPINQVNVCGSTGCVNLTTDSQGVYTLTGLADGQYSVSAVPSFSNQVAGRVIGPLTISGGNQLTGQDVVVDRLRTITGAVFGGTISNTLADAVVQACRAFTSICQTTTTGPLGDYQFHSMAPGDFVITAFPPAGTSFAIGTIHFTLPHKDVLGPYFFLQTPQPAPPNVTITNHGISPGGIPTVNWGDTLTLTATGCAGGSGTFTVTDAGNTVIATGAMSEGPGGTYTGTAPPLFPNHGNAHVSISLSCDSTPIAFDIYIDPSGTVQDQNGSPIAGATVTLFQAQSPGGPFTQVANGSAIMSPGNRSNPDSTDARGHFGWDVVSGLYKVRASAPGCRAPSDASQNYVESGVLTIPPPVTNLVLTLECDTTPPVITPTIVGTTGNNGWYTSDVTVSWDVTDPESAVSSKIDCGTTAITADTDGTKVTCSATSVGGTTAKSVMIKRDATPPTVTFSSHPASYTVDQTVDIACTDGDTLSGLDPASTCPSLTGAPASSFPLGTNALNALAKDMAGNTASATISFTVMVTYGSLCTVTKRFIQSSSKYQALPPAMRASIDTQVSALCSYLSNAQITPTATQKAALVLAYQKSVAALVAPGWLTQSQDDTLTRLSKGL